MSRYTTIYETPEEKRDACRAIAEGAMPPRPARPTVTRDCAICEDCITALRIDRKKALIVRKHTINQTCERCTKDTARLVFRCRVKGGAV